MQHVMIDLETLGLKPSAIIISIGAVKFDLETGELGGKFYAELDVESQKKDRSVCESVLKWWSERDGLALAAFNGTMPLSAALENLKAFLGRNCAVWANGSLFDIAILENAYRSEGGHPWRYNRVYDCRTLRMVHERIIGKYELEMEGVHHNALDDAIYQAKWVSGMYRNINTARR